MGSYFLLLCNNETFKVEKFARDLVSNTTDSVTPSHFATSTCRFLLNRGGARGKARGLRQTMLAPRRKVKSDFFGEFWFL